MNAVVTFTNRQDSVLFQVRPRNGEQSTDTYCFSDADEVHSSHTHTYTHTHETAPRSPAAPEHIQSVFSAAREANFTVDTVLSKCFWIPFDI